MCRFGCVFLCFCCQLLDVFVFCLFSVHRQPTRISMSLTYLQTSKVSLGTFNWVHVQMCPISHRFLQVLIVPLHHPIFRERALMLMFSAIEISNWEKNKGFMSLGRYLLQEVKTHLKVKPMKSLHSHLRSLGLAMAQGRRLTQTKGLGLFVLLCFFFFF